MMRRLVYEKFLSWKNRKNRKPLLVTGVRQCGKTYLIKEFGANEFEEVAYFNFDGNEGLKSVFDYDLNIERIIDELGSIVYGKRIIPGKTLVVFDEVQDCPRAIQSLKYFCEDMPTLHLIAAGSLLGVALRGEGISFPVGKVDRIRMYPLNFEEFVRADGGDAFLEGLKKLPPTAEIPVLYAEPMKKFLRNYYIVGGMPEAVAGWIETHDYDEVDRIQNNILEDYENDFSKHAQLRDVPKIRQIWKSIPEQLAKENNKFVFSHVREGGRARELEDALEWLEDAGLVVKQNLIEKPELPLSYMADSTNFKIFMSDVGLLRKKANVYYGTILNGDEKYIRFKGALAENYVADEINLGMSGLMDPSTAPAVGRVRGAQYTMTGAISLFYYEKKSRGIRIPLIGSSTQTNTAYVMVEIRIIDNSTSGVVYAMNKLGTAKRGTKGMTPLGDILIGARDETEGGALSSAARNAVVQHVNAIKVMDWKD